jgi:hypothetical protein
VRAQFFFPLPLICSIAAVSQMVTIGPQNRTVTCDSETVHPNFSVTQRATVSGAAVDLSYAPFADQKIQLKRNDRVVLTRTTDSAGRFTLGKLPRGKYRLLFGDNREWLQPKRLECAQNKCELEVLVGLKPTDSDYFNALGCPVK